MKLLAIETASRICGVAVAINGEIVGEINSNNGLTHSQTLMPMVEQVLKLSKIRLKEIEAIAVSNGPGSYTGLRIGAACAKGIAVALDKQIIPVCTLTALACILPLVREPIYAILDARADRVYNAVYRYEEGGLQEIIPPRLTTVTEILEQLQQPSIFVGDGLIRAQERIQQNKYAIIPPANQKLQRASALAAAAQNQPKIHYTELKMFY